MTQATEVKSTLLAPVEGAGAGAGAGGAGAGSDVAVPGASANHHTLLLSILAEELGVEIGDIQDFELCLFDTQVSSCTCECGWCCSLFSFCLGVFLFVFVPQCLLPDVACFRLTVWGGWVGGRVGLCTGRCYRRCPQGVRFCAPPGQPHDVLHQRAGPAFLCEGCVLLVGLAGAPGGPLRQ